MMDIDFFKNYNDFYGHTKGDAVLQAVGRVLKATAEEEKLYAARIGGEEFVVLWAENRVLEAERVALKLRERVNALQIPHDRSAAASCVTASFGIYFMRGGSADEPEEMLDAADAAMYKAKEAGRDRIMLLDSADRNCRPVELRPPDELVRG
jgi:diguanylate cyclase (GGDEF)-like protein